MKKRTGNAIPLIKKRGNAPPPILWGNGVPASLLGGACSAFFKFGLGALLGVGALAPQIDRRDLRRVIDGNQDPDWPTPPTWQALTQTITS